MLFADHPIVLFLFCFAMLWLSAQAGGHFRKKRGCLDEPAREELGLIVGATLTLLGLIIGFSFSMATGRYDQRKNCEAQEANAIGTEYTRLRETA